MKYKKINIFKILFSFSLVATPFLSLLSYSSNDLNINSNKKKDSNVGIANIYFEDAKQEFLQLSDYYSNDLFDKYNKAGEGILKDKTPVVQNNLTQNGHEDFNWKPEDIKKIPFEICVPTKGNGKPMFLSQNLDLTNQNKIHEYIKTATQSVGATERWFKYSGCNYNLTNISGCGWTKQPDTWRGLWNQTLDLLNEWTNFDTHHPSKSGAKENVGANGKNYLVAEQIDNNSKIGRYNIHWPAKTIKPSELAETEYPQTSSKLDLQYKSVNGNDSSRWYDAYDGDPDAYSMIRKAKQMPSELWVHVLDTGYFLSWHCSNYGPNQLYSVKNLQFLDGYGGKGHEVWSPIYYSLEDLFEISDIGYDKDKGYWYSLNYNEKLLLAAIAVHGNKGVDNLLKNEFEQNKSKCLINDINYFDFKLSGQKNEFDGGRHTWINPDDLNSAIINNYDTLMDQLYLNLQEFVDSKQLSYDNYFVVKGLIKKYGHDTGQVPSKEYLEQQFKSNSLYQNNGWNIWAEKYSVTEETLEILLTILPQLHISQWSMTNLSDTPENYFNGCWSNIKQENNIGQESKKVGNNEVKYSAFEELITNGNKVYLDDGQVLTDDKLHREFRTNIAVKRDTQNLDKIEVNDQDIHITDEFGTYFPANTNNIDYLNKKTFNGININKKAQDFNEKGARTINSLVLAKDMEKVVTINSFLPKIVIAPKNKYQNMAPSEALASVDGGLKYEKLLKLFTDQLNTDPSIKERDVSPFIKVNINENSFSYEIQDEMLEIISDDTNGEILVRTMAADKTILDTVKIKGFKQGLKPVDPDIPINNNEMSTGAIVGISVGSAVGVAGLGGVTTLIVKKRKPNINKKSKIKDL